MKPAFIRQEMRSSADCFVNFVINYFEYISFSPAFLYNRIDFCIQQHKRGVHMKAEIVAALMLGTSLLFGCSDPAADSINETIEENNEKISESAQSNSEIETAHSREEAAVLLSQSWEIKEPTVIPEGYARMDYYVYDKDMVELRYSDINMSCTIAPAPARAISVETLTPTPVKRRFPANASAISSLEEAMMCGWSPLGNRMGSPTPSPVKKDCRRMRC